MRPLFKNNQQEFDDYISVVSASIQEWQVVTIALTDSCILPYDELIAKVIDMYNGYPGFIYNCGYFRVIAFVKTGRIDNYSMARQELQARLPYEGAFVNIRVASEGLLQELQSKYLQPDESYRDDLDVAIERVKPVVMVADDDMMVAKIMAKAVSDHSDFVHASHGEEVVDLYLQHKPDLLFLDIHMPGKNGLTNLAKLMSLNPFASIIVFSSDSVASKILKALELGAIGFLGKPIKRARVLGSVLSCLSVQGK